VTYPVRALVFDLDGTLVDHEAASLTGLTTLLEFLGARHVTATDVAGDWHRLEEEHWVAYRSGQITFQEQRRLRMVGFLPIIGRAVAIDQALVPFDHYLKGYEAGWVAFDDALAALERARRAGLKTVVLTNGDQAQQEAKLRAAGLDHLSGPVVASSSLPQGKPHPMAYAAACAAAQESAPNVLMIGDNHELDVLAARAAGPQAVHLDRRGNHPATEPSRIATLAELSY
jgi:putative hydrolase of the HAD superfamily